MPHARTAIAPNQKRKGGSCRYRTLRRFAHDWSHVKSIRAQAYRAFTASLPSGRRKIEVAIPMLFEWHPANILLDKSLGYIVN